MRMANSFGAHVMAFFTSHHEPGAPVFDKQLNINLVQLNQPQSSGIIYPGNKLI
jgi:hypothetical protein